MPNHLVTIVFTDVVDSCAVKAVLPGSDLEARNRTFLETIKIPHDRQVLTELAAMSGRVVNEMGDGFFLVFDDPVKAARWAAEVQRSLIDQPIVTPLGRLQVKIGMHIGAPLPNPHNAADFIGHEVNYTARLCALARGGMIVLSETLATLLRSMQPAGLSVHPHGLHDLKGIGRVAAFELLRDGQSPGALAPGIESPTNLPKPPATFIGRDDLLNWVHARLRAGGVTILMGEGGMGKTALAVKAAHAARDAGELPGGAAWLNCEVQPSRDECIRQMARVFFGGRLEQASIDACARQVAAHLERGDALAVFDNFETVDSDSALIGWLADLSAKGPRGNHDPRAAARPRWLREANSRATGE